MLNKLNSIQPLLIEHLILDEIEHRYTREFFSGIEVVKEYQETGLALKSKLMFLLESLTISLKELEESGQALEVRQSLRYKKHLMNIEWLIHDNVDAFSNDRGYYELFDRLYNSLDTDYCILEKLIEQMIAFRAKPDSNSVNLKVLNAYHSEYYLGVVFKKEELLKESSKILTDLTKVKSYLYLTKTRVREVEKGYEKRIKELVEELLF